MDKSDRIKENIKIIKDAVREAFELPEGERVNAMRVNEPTSRARFDDTGQCKETIGEQDIPNSEFHGLASLIVTIPYQSFDSYGAKEEKFKGGSVAGFLNALGQRKTAEIECIVNDFEGNPVAIKFPITVCRGMTPERRASIRRLVRGSLTQ
jgi:hypothetical protein